MNIFLLQFSPLRPPPDPEKGSKSSSSNGGVICKTINVLGATYANCDGLYEDVPGLTVEWAPERPVYKHKAKDRRGPSKESS